MHKIFLVLLSVFSIEIFAKNLIVSVPYNFYNDNYYLTGSFCGWVPDCLKLKKLDQTTYFTNIDERIYFSELKVTRGSWEKDSCRQNGVPMKNFSLSALDSRSQRYFVHKWCDRNHSNKGEFVTFNNLYFPNIKKFKRVKVYLPSNYNERTKWPVLILLDGQNVFDPMDSAFGVEWGADESVEELIKNFGKGMVVIALDNGMGNRTQEYHYFKRGKIFAGDIVKTLLPEMRKRFNLSSERKDTYIGGSSLGAIFAFTTAYEHSDVFSGGIGLSFPAFAYENYVFKFLDSVKSPKLIKFYLDYGGLGQDENYGPSLKDFLSRRELKKHRIFWKKFPHHGHNEISWSHRLSYSIKRLIDI